MGSLGWSRVTQTSTLTPRWITYRFLYHNSFYITACKAHVDSEWARFCRYVYRNIYRTETRTNTGLTCSELRFLLAFQTRMNQCSFFCWLVNYINIQWLCFCFSQSLTLPLQILFIQTSERLLLQRPEQKCCQMQFDWIKPAKKKYLLRTFCQCFYSVVKMFFLNVI